jgi:hypothetical protein
MANDLGSGTFRFVVALLLVGGAVAGSARSWQTLSTPTVPPMALPNGCALKQPASKPVPIAGGGVTVIQGGPSSPFPTNPWSGTDRRIVTTVREAIDGEPRMPDGPPLEARDAAALELKLADNVLQAYHAAYASADGSQTEVFAVTFNDSTLAKPEPLSATMNPSPEFRSRFVRGSTVVVVSGSRSECFRAVKGYIRSLK